MLATTVDEPFTHEDWIFELKLDGYRAIAEIRKGDLLFYSRNGLSFKDRYPAIIDALSKIRKQAILDGEVVLLNEDNRPDFQKLQHYEENRNLPLVYYVFDLLSLQGRDLKGLPLFERKAQLKKFLKQNPVLRYCDHIEKEGIAFFKKIKAENLEGIMAKHVDSLYIPGLRSRQWLKIKNHKSQEAIIVGYTQPKGSRKHFGSLLLAQYKGNQLHYIGHVGTGFAESTLKDLMQKMKPLVTTMPPFDKKITTRGPVTWLKPVLVCEVKYSEITKDGILRHPVYMGLRPDKKSKAIRQEIETSKKVKAVLGKKK